MHQHGAAVSTRSERAHHDGAKLLVLALVLEHAVAEDDLVARHRRPGGKHALGAADADLDGRVLGQERRVAEQRLRGLGDERLGRPTDAIGEDAARRQRECVSLLRLRQVYKKRADALGAGPDVGLALDGELDLDLARRREGLGGDGRGQ